MEFLRGALGLASLIFICFIFSNNRRYIDWKLVLAGINLQILCIMIGGMANTAGSVLAAYVSFLGGADIEKQQFYALHMLSQSIMSAPAAIVCAKILFPQVNPEMVNKDLDVPKEKIGSNALDAIANGTKDGM